MRPTPQTLAGIADMVTWSPDGTPTLTDRRPEPRNRAHRVLRDVTDGLRAGAAVLRDGIDRALQP